MSSNVRSGFGNFLSRSHCSSVLEDAVMRTEETTGQEISLYINHKMDLFNQRSKQISVYSQDA